MSTIGENIRDARKSARLTQVELAKKTKLSRSYIGDIEKDRYNPSLSTLQSIADATGVPVERLLGAESSPQVIKGDPVSEIFDNPDIRGLARRSFKNMSDDEIQRSKERSMKLMRAMFEDEEK